MRKTNDHQGTAGWYLDPQSGEIRRVVAYVAPTHGARRHGAAIPSVRRFQLYEHDPHTPPGAPPSEAPVVAEATLGVQFFHVRSEAAAAALLICDRALAVARLVEERARARLWAAHDHVVELEARRRRLQWGPTADKTGDRKQRDAARRVAPHRQADTTARRAQTRRAVVCVRRWREVSEREVSEREATRSALPVPTEEFRGMHSPYSAPRQPETQTSQQTARRPVSQPPGEAAPPLPSELTPWRSYARAHHIPPVTVWQAIKGGAVPLTTGEWRTATGRTATQTLGALGRLAFMRLYRSHPDFTPCFTCDAEREVALAQALTGANVVSEWSPERLVVETRVAAHRGETAHANELLEALVRHPTTRAITLRAAKGIPGPVDREDAIADMLEEILRKARDPAQTFMAQNYRYFAQKLAIDHFHRALRAAGREYRRDDAGRPLGRPHHVPHALVTSMETADGRERALDDLRLSEETGVGATTLDRDEARRILSYIDDPVDRYTFYLRAVAGLTWQDIVDRLAQAGRPYVERTVRERYDATRAYLRDCIEIEIEREDLAQPVTPELVHAEAARRGYRQMGRAQQSAPAASPGGLTAGTLATHHAEPEPAAARAQRRSASPIAISTGGTPAQSASGAHDYDHAIHGKVAQEDTDMSNGGANDLNSAPATTEPVGDDASTTTATPARRITASDDQLALSADDASGDDPAPDQDEVGVVVFERLFQSVTARLPRRGQPWTDAEREAYLAAFDRFTTIAHLYSDFWPRK